MPHKPPEDPMLADRVSEHLSASQLVTALSVKAPCNACFGCCIFYFGVILPLVTYVLMYSPTDFSRNMPSIQNGHLGDEIAFVLATCDLAFLFLELLASK
jgi:hypothetical protein